MDELLREIQAEKEHIWNTLQALKEALIWFCAFGTSSKFPLGDFRYTRTLGENYKKNLMPNRSVVSESH